MTTDMCFLTVLEVPHLNQGVDKAISVGRLEGRVLPWLLVGPGVPWLICITSISAFSISWLSRFLCLYLLSSYRNTSHVA